MNALDGIQKGDRVCHRVTGARGTVVGKAEVVYEGTAFEFTTVTIELDEPIACFCGETHSGKMIALPPNWERLPRGEPN